MPLTCLDDGSSDNSSLGHDSSDNDCSHSESLGKGSKKIVSIHQPHYFPWLGLLDKIACSDVHIVLDSVQFRKRYFQNRAQYATLSGPKFLSLPVQSKGIERHDLIIQKALLLDYNDLSKHYSTLKHNYGKAPGWGLIQDRLYEILHTAHTHLLDLNMELLLLSLHVFNISTRIELATELESTLATVGVKSDRILALTQAVEGQVYLSGNGARSYMDEHIFKEAQVDVVYQKFDSPTYPQHRSGAFLPGCFGLEYFLMAPDEASQYFSCRLKDYSL